MRLVVMVCVCVCVCVCVKVVAASMFNHVECLCVDVQGWKASTPANSTLAVANSTGKLLAFFAAPEVEFILELDSGELLATSPAPAITPL